MTTLITEKVSLTVQNTRESLSSYFLCPLFLRTDRCRSGLGPDWTASAWAMYRQSAGVLALVWKLTQTVSQGSGR